MHEARSMLWPGPWSGKVSFSQNIMSFDIVDIAFAFLHFSSLSKIRFVKTSGLSMSNTFFMHLRFENSLFPWDVL